MLRRWTVIASLTWALAGAVAALTPRIAAAPDWPPDRRSIKVRYAPVDVQTGRYQYVPVEVPAGVTRLTIDYRYDRAGGANVIDLGLFEPGPLDLGTPAFRGWSGGERASITISPQYATPGYWPGAVPEGRWHVMLGLYKVAPAGVDVELLVEVGHEPAGPTPPLAPRPREPLRRGPAWYSGGLHMHTLHSDGTLSAASLARAARAAGLHFIAITDHNNTAHQLEPVEQDGLLRIVGEEVTTPGGHFNVWGLGGVRDYVDFRLLPAEGRAEGLTAEVARRGALVAINHPTSECLACGWTHPIPSTLHAIEIVNARHDLQRKAIGLWDGLLGAGRRVTGVGTADWHRGPQPMGMASVRVWAEELSTAAVLGAIREGRVVVMADAATPPPELVARAGKQTARVGDTLRLSRGGRYEVELSAPAPAYEGARVALMWDGAPAGEATLSPGTPARFPRRAEQSGYLRAHIFKKDGAPLAITNPVWLAVGTR